MSIVTLEDKTNELLRRREVRCVFKGSAGKLGRKDAVQMLSKELKLDKKLVIPVNLQCETGRKDVRCTFYVYDDENLARKHLPKYLFMRLLTEEERKAAKEAEKPKQKPAEEAPSAKAKEEPKEEKSEKAEAKGKVEKPKQAPAEGEKPKKEAKGAEEKEETKASDKSKDEKKEGKKEQDKEEAAK